MPDLPSFASQPQQEPLDRLRQAQDELDSLERELEHSHRLATLGTLAAGIAHEINNILTPVLAYAQLASNSPADRQLQAKALQKTVQGVQNATQITQAMLGFASAPEEPQWANILDVLQAALDCIGRDPAKDRINLTVNAHPDLCVQIRPLALQQVLMNLILNACSAMRNRGGELAVSAVGQADGTSIIRLSDNGPGIPAEVVGRLFEPFATGRRNAKQPKGKTGGQQRQTDGTGLGLAICKRLVEAAAGNICASSKPGKGATFTITLPTAKLPHAKTG